MAQLSLTITIDDTHLPHLLAVTGDSDIARLRTRLTEGVEQHIERLLDTWRASIVDRLRNDLRIQSPAILQRAITAARNELP